MSISSDLAVSFPEDRNRWPVWDKKRNIEQQLSGRAFKRIACLNEDVTGLKIIVYRDYVYQVKFITTDKFAEFNVYSCEGKADLSKLNLYVAGKTLKPVVLNPQISHNLAKLISEGRPVKEFSCVDFINYLFDMWQEETLNEFFWNEWNVMVMQDVCQLAPGEVIFLSKTTVLIENNQVPEQDMSCVRHFALHLGSNLFISLYGEVGLFVTSLEKMHAYYETCHTYILKPAD